MKHISFFQSLMLLRIFLVDMIGFSLIFVSCCVGLPKMGTLMPKMRYRENTISFYQPCFTNEDLPDMISIEITLKGFAYPSVLWKEWNEFCKLHPIWGVYSKIIPTIADGILVGFALVWTME